MTELQYPSTTGTEKELLVEYLDWYRAAILRKLEGASEETLRKKLLPSRTTLLGIVKHLAWVEIWWFQEVMAGRVVEEPPHDENDHDWDWDVDAESTEEIVNFYKQACDESRAIVASMDLDALSLVEHEKTWNLRRTMIHMIEETARHAGHADIIRELIDGQTGP